MSKPTCPICGGESYERVSTNQYGEVIEQFAYCDNCGYTHLWDGLSEKKMFVDVKCGGLYDEEYVVKNHRKHSRVRARFADKCKGIPVKVQEWERG